MYRNLWPMNMNKYTCTAAQQPVVEECFFFVEQKGTKRCRLDSVIILTYWLWRDMNWIMISLPYITYYVCVPSVLILIDGNKNHWYVYKTSVNYRQPVKDAVFLMAL